MTARTLWKHFWDVGPRIGNTFYHLHFLIHCFSAVFSSSFFKMYHFKKITSLAISNSLFFYNNLKVMFSSQQLFRSFHLLSKWWLYLTSASKFGKLSSGHRTGKGQFSFQSQRKAMPKNAQTTARLHSSHMIVK